MILGRLLLCGALALLLLSERTQCQIMSLGNDVSRPIAGAGHDYIHLLGETVNPANGSLNLKIQLPAPSGRGLSLPVALYYNSGGVHQFVSGLPGMGIFLSDSLTAGTSGGWQSSMPYVAASVWATAMPSQAGSNASCAYSGSYNFYDPSGESHMLGLSAISYVQNDEGMVGNGYCATLPNMVTSLAGGDAHVKSQSLVNCTGYHVTGQPDQDGCDTATLSFTVTTKDGTVYSFPRNGMVFSPTPGDPAGTVFLYPVNVEDRNGNVIQNTSPTGISLVDTLGKPVVSVTGANPKVYSVAGLDYAVSATTSTANYTSPSQQINAPPSSIYCDANFDIPSPPESYYPSDTGVSNVISTIALPNGTQYKFFYDRTYGLLNEVDYPDGAWVKYTWKLNDTLSDLASFDGTDSNKDISSGVCLFKYKTPAIATRLMGVIGSSTPVQSQTFAYSTVWDPSYPYLWDSKTTTVITTDNKTGKSSQTVYTYGSVSPPRQPDAGAQSPSQIPVETSVQYYDWSNTTAPLQTVYKTWINQYEMVSQKTVWANGQSTATVYCYLGATDSLAEKDEYDYGWPSPSMAQASPIAVPTIPSCAHSATDPHGNPTRATVYTYQGFYGVPTNPANPYGSYSFSGKILDRPCQIVTYDGSSNRVAETDLQYDGGPTLCGAPGTAQTTGVSGLVTGTHDEVHFGPTSTNQDGSTNSRGNVTKMTKWSNTSASPTTIYTYDETGQVTSMTDPCGNTVCADMVEANHTTTYSYTDNPIGGDTAGNSNAYLTEITYPSANGITQQNSFAFNYTTGNLTSVTDANTKTTGYQYVDSLNRLTETDYPDGGKITIRYNDSAPSPSVTTSQLLNADGAWKTSVSIMDGLGRTVQTQLTSDPVSPVSVDTTYDGIGNVMSVSNPYRSSPAPNDPPYGMTSFAYDALGRRLLQCQPDNGNNTPCVAGNSYLQWSYNGDVTTFYDELHNSWQRTTDALGRLTNVVEPGNLPTAYSYDALGNLQNVTQTGIAGETPRVRSFTYDSLSRLITATNPETGAVCYGVWSGANCINGYDANGNLVAKEDARAITTAYTYDALNRMLTKTTSDGTTSSFYQYDNFTGWGQPHGASIGRVARAVGCNATLCEDDLYGYDPMGRINHIEGATPSEAGHSAHWTQMQYDLAGNLTGLRYPDGNVVTSTFDSAGRLSSVIYALKNTPYGFMTGGTSVNTPYISSIAYLPDGTPSQTTFGNGVVETVTQNNRLQMQSLMAWTPMAPFNSQPFLSHTYCYTNCPTGGTADNGNIWQITDTLKSSNTQSFTYDALNRITSFGLGGVANQSFQMDSFGNMSPALAGTAIYSFSPTTNRISNLPCVSYATPFDADGNQTCDTDPNGATRIYTYDGESRIDGITMTGSSQPFESYVYDADGNRIRKSNADGTFTEHVDFGGQTIAEKDQTGAWTDYIYGSGKRIAMISPDDTRFHLTGVNGQTSDTNRWVVGIAPFPANFTIQAGDVLNFRMYQHNANAGIGIDFTDNSNSDWYCGQCHQQIAADVWVNRSIPLGGTTSAPSVMVDKTFSSFQFGNYQGGANGEFDVMMADISVSHADGSITQFPISIGSWPWGGDTTAVTNGSFVGEQVLANSGQVGAIANTRFLLGDHLGTAQMEFSSGGWPMWQGRFAPYGQELDTQATANHYKFTGKERDTESGLDYFGARYYSNSMGRWMSPDWADKPEAVPYSSLDNPQSLNLYGYVLNNPLSKADPDGHEDGDTKDRLITGATGVANLVVAGFKGVGVVGEFLATPVTGGASAALGAYEAVQTVGQGGAGLTQIGGAISGKTDGANAAADGMIVATSIAGSATLAATKGNMDAATKAAAVEGMVSAGATRTVFKTVGTMVDTVMNINTTAQKPTPAPKPPAPSPPPAPKPPPPPKKDNNQ